MTAKQDQKVGYDSVYPNCPLDCRAAHTIKFSMFLLGVGRTKLYELMNSRQIKYITTHYGRRIRHDEIERYLLRITADPN